MEVDEDYESDSTVRISDLSKNPEKIARKRRKLDALIRKISHTDKRVASDPENTAPNVPSVNLPKHRKEDRNNNPETKQWLMNKFLGDCDVDKNNDSTVEDLKVKKELLKQENESEGREGIDNKEVNEDCVIISDDSDDDCTIITHETNRSVDKNTNLNPRIGVLTPSAINTRRATLDSFAKNETASNISDSVMSPNPNTVNPKLTVLKPSAINSRRATFNSFERNEATSNNVIKHVNFSSGESKNKEGNDNNKTNETTNKQVNETNRFSEHKSYGEHPPKLTTPNQSIISRKRNIDVVIQGKPGNLQAENIILTPKSNEIAAVIKIAKRNKSTDSSSVVHSKGDVLARNVKETSEIQEKVDTGVVSSSDSNKTDADLDKTAQKNTIDNVCKDVTVTKNIDINNSIDGNANNSVDAESRVKDQVTNLSKIPVDIGLIDDSKKENKDSTDRYKSADAKDRQFNTNVSCSNLVSNTNAAENPILQELKNIMEQNIVQGEDTGVLDDSAKVNEQLSNADKSGGASRIRTEIQTPNKDVLCSSTVSHSNSLENSVIDVLKKMIIEDKAYQTETGECSKCDEKAESAVDNDQEINLNQCAKDNREKEICRDKAHKRSTEFLISFFKNVKDYLKVIFLKKKLASKLRAPARTLKREIKCILHDAKKHGTSQVRYACPKCSQILIYSPVAIYKFGDDENPIREQNTLNCKLCLGLQIIHTQTVNDKNCDEINSAAENRQENTNEQLSTGNNNVAINRNNSAFANPNAGASIPDTSVTSNKNEVSNIFVNSLASKSLDKTATSANNDVPTKTSQNRNKHPTLSNENDEITSGNDKIKLYKRSIDNNRSPIDPKRVKTDTNTRDESTKVVKGNSNYETELGSTTIILSSFFIEPATSNNSAIKIISNIDATYNKVSRPRDCDETVSRNENKAQLTRTLVDCFTKFQIKENHENSERANVHTCPVCPCVYGSRTSLIEHMRDKHNIPENLKTITCPLCNVHLNETNYMAHVKVHFPDENTEVVESETSTGITNISKNVNTTDADTEQQKKTIVAKSTEGKQYECTICKEVLYSLFATRKHRKKVHGHLDLKNKKLFIVTEKERVGPKSVHSQSSTCLETSEDRNPNSGHEEIADLKTVIKINKHKESGKNAAKTRDFKQHCNNSKDQTNLGQNCNESIDDQKKKKQKPVNDNINIIQEEKPANVIKSLGEVKIKATTSAVGQTDERNYDKGDQYEINLINAFLGEHEHAGNRSRSHTIDDTTTKGIVIESYETKKDVDSVKQRHKSTDNDNLQTNAEMISEHILYESNTQSGIIVVAESSSQPELDKTEKMGEINDINLDGTEDSNEKQTHKSRDSNNLQTNAEMISEPILYESNTQGGMVVVAESSSQPEVDKTGKMGEINDINMNKTEDSNIEQTHKSRDNDNLQTNAEMISKPLKLHESNTQGGIIKIAESSSEPEVDKTGKMGEINDVNMDRTEDSNKKSISENSYPEIINGDESNKLPDADSSQNVDHINTKEEDENSREHNKYKCIFPTTPRRPILANCYNCQSNIDVNDMNNHDCRQKIVGTLYNCFSCGVCVLHDDNHKCENEHNYCIENIQITKIVTVKEVHVFKCEHCNSATEVYDDIIKHCQNHYNGINEPIAFCNTCQLFYNTDRFETHKHLHEEDMKIISYSYKSLFSNWNRTFGDMPSNVVEEMQARSIYKSHCVKMNVLKEGPWQYTLYQCSQCETCVAPGKIDQHCRRQCYFVAYPCSICGKLFASYLMCSQHELDHRATELFKIIEFNCKKDEHFNFKLFEARKIEMESRIPIADIFKCICGLCFISNDGFKKHFAGCNLEDKGVLCPRCASPRLFEDNELENHLLLHHSAVAYRFRVSTIVIQQDVETFDVLDRDVSRNEDDVKRECLKEENNERTV